MMPSLLAPVLVDMVSRGRLIYLSFTFTFFLSFLSFFFSLEFGDDYSAYSAFLVVDVLLTFANSMG